MVVSELVAVLGAKVNQGEFADVFALINNLGSIFSKVFNTIESGIAKAFDVTNTVANAGDKIGKLSETLDIAAEDLQGLSAAAADDVGGIEEFADGMAKLAMASKKAAEGNKEALAAFGGVKLKAANGELKRTDELLLDLSASFQKVTDPAKRLQMSMELFGKGKAKEFAHFLAKGPEQINTLRQEYLESGAALTQAQIDASNEVSDANWRLAWSQQGLANAFATPATITALGKFKVAIAGLTNNETSRKVLEKLGNVFAFLLTKLSDGATKLTTWLNTGSNAALVVDILTAAVQTMGTALAYISVTALPGLIAAAWGLAAPFIPVALALGALFLLFDDLNIYLKGGDSLIGRLENWINRDVPIDSNPFIKFLHEVLRLAQTIEKTLSIGIAGIDWSTFNTDIVAWLKDVYPPFNLLLTLLSAIEKVATTIASVWTSLGRWSGVLAQDEKVSPLVALKGAANLGGIVLDTQIKGIGAGVSYASDAVTTLNNYITINAQGANAEEVVKIIEQQNQAQLNQTAHSIKRGKK